MSPDEIEAAKLKNTASKSASHKHYRFVDFRLLLSSITKDVRASIDVAPVGKIYFIANNFHINRVGFYWVPVVYEMKALPESSLIVSPQLERTHDINTRINFEADADFNNASSSLSLPPATFSFSSFSSSSSSKKKAQ